MYLKDGVKGTGVNIEFLHVLGQYLSCLEVPWIAAGDWNMSPGELRATGWLGQVAGDMIAPSGFTCSAGGGDTLDYFVVSAGLASRCTGAGVWSAAPSSPHSPVWLTIRPVESAQDIVQRVRWKVFPARPPVGCAPKPIDFEWSWEVGSAPEAELQACWREWVQNAEQQL